MQGTKNLTKGPILKQLFNLAMPIMATSFIQMAYSLTDMAWVGRIGSEAVAAVGSVGILTWMSGSISLLNKVGSEVSVGQAIGSQNEKAAKAFASHNITISLLISICWAALLFSFARPIINIYQLKADISVNAVEYLRIISTALPFVFLSATFTGIYNASGRSKTPFVISGIGLIMNMIFDPLFIFVFHWGTIGAAVATWVSQACVFVLFLYQLKYRKTLLGGFPFITRLQKKYSKQIFKIGLPVAILNTLFAFVNMFMGRLASEQGGHIGLMTLTTGGQIEAITWNTSQGFSTALGAFIAQNYAARQNIRIIKAYKTTLWMTSIFGTLCTLLFVFYGKEVFSIFVPETEAYLAGGVYMRISGYSQLFMMLEITTQGMFYGTGRTIPPAIISISCNYLRIPLALLFVSIGMGISGIWWSISITSIMKGIIASLWFTIIKRKILTTPLSQVVD
ncbi:MULTISPECIES: MATE family efflux transporter [unclassified Bacteroides]|jgi:putative MATE family efflux protein|uniref:MATE family efflux transporter n=1 Tax=unclassified Bacteroides TaxID=2646097 RepID=UPI000E8EB46C|nr:MULTISPECIES: MATE family efflux transporter [unclassified Bacteroides]RGN44606.1 MATE family efflux transporter [Bacteroides sp. OM05-12]RHR72373.1 MATE family efflux transporter [Bacteroides sp. AF16-49]